MSLEDDQIEVAKRNLADKLLNLIEQDKCLQQAYHNRVRTLHFNNDGIFDLENARNFVKELVDACFDELTFRWTKLNQEFNRDQQIKMFKKILNDMFNDISPNSIRSETYEGHRSFTFGR